MKRRFIAPLAAVAASGLVLAGCSSDSDPETSGTAGGSTDGGEVVAGCEDYATYGTFDGSAVEALRHHLGRGGRAGSPSRSRRSRSAPASM
ncbi:hypothetical protein [Demequina litorisediminis]|uniref:hypothetical protein n=1 Tax=Demequina litorisediminis TaxID=1849022 RepID=UPI0024E08E08|nr:hypothetical protein [Demequina litorisediminis]